MNGSLAALALLACAGLAACAGDDTQATAAPVAVAAPAPAPAAVPSAPIAASLTGAGGVWRVRILTCAQLLAAPPRDRDAALMFYYGRLAQRAGTQEIEVGKLDFDLRRAMDQCARTPNLPAAAAFQQPGQEPSTTPRWFWEAL